jgi:hypothetical protein
MNKEKIKEEDQTEIRAVYLLAGGVIGLLLGAYLANNY